MFIRGFCSLAVLALLHDVLYLVRHKKNTSILYRPCLVRVQSFLDKVNPVYR
jgi:hypothetical protein